MSRSDAQHIPLSTKAQLPQQFIRPAILPAQASALNTPQHALPPTRPNIVQPAFPTLPSNGNNQPVPPALPLTQPPGQVGMNNFSLPARPRQVIQSPVVQPFQPPQLVQSNHPVEYASQRGQVPPQLNTPIVQFPIEVVKGRPSLIEPHERFDEDDNAESYIATSVAAERWRTSWRNRQRKEAGPATLASRGQSSVQEPLMAMQQSLVRMRAIIVPKASHNNLRFWLPWLLMLCLITGLVAFIASTFQTNAAPISQNIQQVNIPPPSLNLQGKPTATIVQGQTLALHGENFDAGAPILFLLDGTMPINGTDGRELVVLASNQGSFSVTIHDTSAWSAGPHVIDANNNKNSQRAYLNVIVGLAGSAPTSSPDLALSVESVTFHALVGQSDPQEQFVTLTNTNTSSPVRWIARAVTDNGLAWLDVDAATTGGNLGLGGTGTVGIRAMVTDLTNFTKPYTGHIIFTINQREQLTLPVELQLSGGTPEIAINPNPLIGVLSSTGEGCQPGTTLLLTNLGNEPVHWSLSLDTVTATHIQLLFAGKPSMQGILAPAGQQNDSKVLTLQCVHVQNGDIYNFTLQSGTQSWTVEVSIRTSQ